MQIRIRKYAKMIEYVHKWEIHFPSSLCAFVIVYGSYDADAGVTAYFQRIMLLMSFQWRHMYEHIYIIHAHIVLGKVQFSCMVHQYVVE